MQIPLTVIGQLRDALKLYNEAAAFLLNGSPPERMIDAVINLEAGAFSTLQEAHAELQRVGVERQRGVCDAGNI